jgi:hypothetical protein
VGGSAATERGSALISLPANFAPLTALLFPMVEPVSCMPEVSIADGPGHYLLCITERQRDKPRGLPATDFRKRLIKYRFGARGSVAIGIAAESQMIRCLRK